MPFTEEAADYFDTSPMSADWSSLAPEQFSARGRAVSELPENLRRTILSVQTSDRLQELGRQHNLRKDQVQDLAVLLGRILRGEMGAANFTTLVRQILAEANATTVSALTTAVTREFISPNYFQIVQVYEQKQKVKRVDGREPESAEAPRGGQAAGAMATAPALTSLASPTPPSAPPRVVDLRNGGVPSRLPPSPQVALQPKKPAAPAVTPMALTPAPLPAPMVAGTPIPPRPSLPPKPTSAPPVSPPPTPPARRVEPGKPLDDMTPSQPPTPASPRPSPPPMRPAGGSGTHGPLPPSPVVRP